MTQRWRYECAECAGTSMIREEEYPDEECIACGENHWRRVERCPRLEFPLLAKSTIEFMVIAAAYSAFMWLFYWWSGTQITSNDVLAVAFCNMVCAALIWAGARLWLARQRWRDHRDAEAG